MASVKPKTFVRQHWVIDEFDFEMSQGGSWHFKEGHPLNAVGWRPAIDVELWAAAAEFTRERLRQIAEVKEEIAWLNGVIGHVTGPVLARILRREQDALAALKKGMR
jgi:hypothetical protein